MPDDIEYFEDKFDHRHITIIKVSYPEETGSLELMERYLEQFMVSEMRHWRECGPYCQVPQRCGNFTLLSDILERIGISRKKTGDVENHETSK